MVMSKKKLVPMLVERGFIESEKAISYEAFGRKVNAYVRVKDMATRKALEAHLRSVGQKFNPSYSPGRPVVEAQVSYFKAWHWDE